MVVARDALRHGHLPLWNPYEYGGMTLVGNLQSALFLPLTWILLVLPLGYAWGVLAVRPSWPSPGSVQIVVRARSGPGGPAGWCPGS